MKKTSMTALLAGAALLCAMSLPALAESKGAAGEFTAQQARAITDPYAPAGSDFLYAESDGGRYEVKYLTKGSSETYEFHVSKATKSIVAFDSDRLGVAGTSAVLLDEAAAKAVVTGEFPGAKNLAVELETDDGQKEYKVRFQTETLYGDYTISPENGTILERDLKIGTRPASSDTASFVGIEQAAKAAQAQAPGAVVTDVDLEREGGAYYYEVELYQNGVEMDVAVDAATGKVLWSGSHKRDWTAGSGGIASASPAAGVIGAQKAQEIALAKAPGATVRECKLDEDDGRLVYEGELRRDGWEIEFEIDAVSGEILSWDIDD